MPYYITPMIAMPPLPAAAATLNVAIFDGRCRCFAFAIRCRYVISAFDTLTPLPMLRRRIDARFILRFSYADDIFGADDIC